MGALVFLLCSWSVSLDFLKQFAKCRVCSVLAAEPGPWMDRAPTRQSIIPPRDRPASTWAGTSVLLLGRSSPLSPRGVSRGSRICRSLWRISVLHIRAHQLPSLLTVALLVADALARLGHGCSSSVTCLWPFTADGAF